LNNIAEGAPTETSSNYNIQIINRHKESIN